MGLLAVPCGVENRSPPLIEYEIRVKRIKKMYHDELKKRSKNVLS